MTKIKKYTKKDGSTAYKFNIYLGIDPKTGKRKRTNRHFATLKEAKVELKKLEYQATQGITEHKETNITFEEVYNEWFEGYVNTVRESTWYKKKKIFENHILPAFGKYRIRSITTAQIQSELNKWFKSTTNNFKPWFYYTSAIFKYAIQQQYITDNPAKRVIMPRKTEHIEKEPNFWNKDELKTFFDFIDSKKELERYTLFRILAFTGIRRGECLALTWNDFNNTENILQINKTLTQGIGGKQIIQDTKTIKGTRTIPLDTTTIKYLNLWRIQDRKELLKMGFNIGKGSQLIFHSNTNHFKSLNTPKKWLDLIMKRVNSEQTLLHPITIHGFRHSYASALFASGATIKEAQTLLGHEDAQTTLNIYTHVTADQNKKATEKLVKFLNF
ncbi:tyrosine-type recombinase/integrase [Companilactobacillus zhongbaensis]|uniref:tyrosine-type recombinase/integrase n=1 Tax=Companilactobacillus zhongbaensis TaxID=2486009 RepID=UPI000F7A2F9E|nr:site-specific integrase [Companilactobacillus zhongbaensis]